MGALGALIDAIFPETRSVENPTKPLSVAGLEDLGETKTHAGTTINGKTVLTLSAVWRGINILSSDVAKLPLFVYKRTDRGKERDPGHPAYALLRYDASNEMTAFTFQQTLTWHAIIHGGGFAYIERDALSRPTALLPLDPTKVVPVRENQQLWYVLDSAAADPVKIRPEHILHVRGVGDSLVGFKLVDIAKQSMGLTKGMEEYGSRFFSNNAMPNLVLEAPAALDDGALKRLLASWKKMTEGLSNAHRTAVLEEGIKAHELTIPAKEAQLFESRGFQIREMANWLGVHPNLLGDTTATSFASLEQVNQSHLDRGVDPWLVIWESECRRKLLTEEQKRDDTHVVEFLRQAFVRADLSTRTEAYTKAIGGPWMKINEARALENLPLLDEAEGGVLNKAPNTPGDAAPPPKPTDTPPPPATEPDDDDDDERQNLVDVHTRLLADTVRRMIHRLGVHARKAAKKPDKFDEWLSGFRAEHVDVLKEMSAPVVEACQAALGQARLNLHANLVVGLLGSVHDALDDVCQTTTKEEFAAAIDARMTQLENDLPEQHARAKLEEEKSDAAN